METQLGVAEPSREVKEEILDKLFDMLVIEESFETGHCTLKYIFKVSGGEFLHLRDIVVKPPDGAATKCRYSAEAGNAQSDIREGNQKVRLTVHP